MAFSFGKSLLHVIRVNYVRFNMAAADAQSHDLDIWSLWAWYTIMANVWVFWAPTGLGVQMSLSALTYFFVLFSAKLSKKLMQLFHFGDA